MKIKQFDIWLADLNPAMGTEPGKTRPVVIVQTDLINDIHPSTIICPITTKVKREIQLMRVHLKKGLMQQPSDILCDQVRAIDNRRLIKKTGSLNKEQIGRLRYSLKIMFDMLE